MYRKFKANKLFTGYQMLDGTHVLITDEKGIVIEILNESDAGLDIEVFEGILSPGFINAHCHLELSHLKGKIPEQTGLVNFLLKVINERSATEEEVTEAIANAENEMFENGIIAIGDICNTKHSIQQKQKNKLRYYNFIEATGFVPQAAQQRFNDALKNHNAFQQLQTTNHQPQTINPHAPYSVSKELFQIINNHNSSVLTIHNQESKDENDFFINATGDFLRLYEELNIDISFYQPSGKASLQTYLPYLTNQQNIILVHNVCINQNDINFQTQQSTTNYKPQTYYCLCPNANKYITSTLPNINLLLKNNCNIVLGTDSLASNHKLDIFSEIKTLQQSNPNLSLETALQWATINGAKALQMDANLGSFEKGKQPGVVLINTEKQFTKRVL